MYVIYYKEYLTWPTEPSTNTTDVDQVMAALRYFRWPGDEDACRLYFEFGGQVLRGYGNSSSVGVDGQKAVCLDPGVAPPPGQCIVYSFGISNDWTFDEAMQSYGCDVYAFDPTIGQKSHQHSPRVHFFNLGLAERMVRDGRGHKYATLDAIRAYLRHTHLVIDYLKMDIEGYEWPVLRHLISTGILSKVRQIAIEIHLLDGPRLFEHADVLRDLERSGFVRFFSRENIWMRNTLNSFVPLNDSAGYEIAWFNGNYSVRH